MLDGSISSLVKCAFRCCRKYVPVAIKSYKSSYKRKNIGSSRKQPHKWYLSNFQKHKSEPCRYFRREDDENQREEVQHEDDENNARKFNVKTTKINSRKFKEMIVKFNEMAIKFNEMIIKTNVDITNMELQAKNKELFFKNKKESKSEN